MYLQPVVSSTTSTFGPTVRFGRVPKREKAKILAAMQCVNARSQENAMAVELEDESKLVETIVTAHHQTCDYTSDKLEPLMQQARDQPHVTQCSPQLACPLMPNPTLVSGNPQVMEDFSERFSPAIRNVVEFAKRIPGFGLLSQDDQVTLLKAGVFEVLLVRLACMFDARNQTMICLNGQLMKREDLQHTSNARFLMDSMFDFAERINMLRLLDSEIGLFCAVVVIAADRPGLRNTDLVQKMQGKMMDALSHAVSHNHPQSPNLMQELMKKIPDLRTLNTLHSEKLLAFKMDPHLTGIDHEHQEVPDHHQGDDGPQLQHEEVATSQHCATNMHALYQTQVDHWNAYGMASSKGPVICNEDSKGSWEESDHTVPSPYLPHHQHQLMQQQQQQQHHQMGVLMHGHDNSQAWSPDSQSDPGKEHELYGGSPGSSSDNGSGSFMADDSCVRSPMGSLSSAKGSGADSESVCSGEMAHLSPNTPKRRHEGSSSGDESCSPNNSPGDNSANANEKHCPYKTHCNRKLDSPTDSGIESGKELSSAPSRGTSVCSSPRSLVMDEDKLSKDSRDEESTQEDNCLSLSPPLSRLPTRDMPVLKRALQAPPLINTALLMDEAYKPHKKFRALRKDSDSASPTPASPEAPVTVSGRSLSPFSGMPTVQQTVVATMPVHKTVAPLPSLASTHSMLVRSLEQAPRMSEQQLKRTDIIHNIIMCNETQQQQQHNQHQQQHGQNYSMPTNGVMYGSGQTNFPQGASPVTKSGSVLVCPPGYYIPQIGSNGNSHGSTPVTQANWSTFVAGAQTMTSTAPTATCTSSLASPSQHPSRSLFVPVSASSNTVQQMSQLQQHLQMSQQQQQTKNNQTTTMSPPLHPHQHHHYQITQQQQQQQQSLGNGHQQAPRLYYHLQQNQQRSSSAAGTSPSPRSNPPSPVPAVSLLQQPLSCKPVQQQQQQQQNQQQFSLLSSSPLKSASPVTMIGQHQQGELRRLMVSNGPSSGENQPLNLSKKVASPPPQQQHMSVLMASLQDCSTSAIVHQSRMKLEVL